MLIFNKQKHYEKLMSEGFEKYPNKRDLLILCDIWMQKGISLSSLKDNIIDFCLKWNSEFNYAKNENLILSVIKEISKDKSEKSFEFNTTIVFYESEINKIKEIKDKNLQKILFIMISLAKWRNANYIYLNSGSSIKLKDIFNLARLKFTGKQQKMALYQLNSAGYTDVQLKPLLKLFIPCIEQEGNEKLSFIISDDMIDEWLDITLPHCERCGKPFEKKSNKQKYCKECAKIVKNEQNRSYLQKGK